MRAYERLNHIPIEQVGFFDGFARERVEQQRFEDAAQPVVRRDVEAFFAALQNLDGQFVTHQMLEDYFERGVADFQILWQARGEVDDAAVGETPARSRQ